MTINRINFTSIPVENQDRALAFYTEILGFEVVVDAPYAEDWRWIFVALKGAETRLQFARKGEITFNDVPALVLTCDDIDEECIRLKAAGVDIVNGPDDAPWAAETRWAMVKDTEDNLILIESLKKEA
ncbi:MAG: VOC family protein [Alphaproteobacteria bacterium]|nr:VOC family protein [Alphaproteobacteria bacterium]